MDNKVFILYVWYKAVQLDTVDVTDMEEKS